MAASSNNLLPEISVIVPAYNYGHFLLEALESVRNQTFRQWECLVIDDGSTDETATLVKRLSAIDARIRYIWQPNQGQPAARNNGLAHAQGKYIQFLDADDKLQHDKLAAHHGFLENHDVDIVYGMVRYFQSHDPDRLFLNRWDDEWLPWMPMVSGAGLQVLKEFVTANILELGCCLFRKNVFEKIGGFDARLKGVEDYDLCLRAASNNLHFQYCESFGADVLMRHHASSFSKSELVMYKQELKMRQKMISMHILPSENLRERNRRVMAVITRKLQNRIIDLIRKQQFRERGLVGWVFANSGLNDNLYLMPRLLKALIFRNRNNSTVLTPHDHYR